MRKFLLFSVCCLTLAAAGCSGSGPSGSVTGTITKGGQPVAAQIAFKSNTASASGVSDASGTYTLMKGQTDNIPVGKYQVSVTDVSSSVGAEGADYNAMMEGGGDSGAAKKESTIPEKYHSFGTSGLEFEVTQGANTIDITLE